MAWYLVKQRDNFALPVFVQKKHNYIRTQREASETKRKIDFVIVCPWKHNLMRHVVIVHSCMTYLTN